MITNAEACPAVLTATVRSMTRRQSCMIMCTPTAMATTTATARTTACPERNSIGEETEEGDTREIPRRYLGDT